LGRSSICKVTFIFVPGHVSFKGNERADTLTNCAVIGDGQPMDRADLVNNLMEIGRKEKFENRVDIAAPNEINGD
jgi:hypothetical protein